MTTLSELKSKKPALLPPDQIKEIAAPEPPQEIKPSQSKYVGVSSFSLNKKKLEIKLSLLVASPQIYIPKDEQSKERLEINLGNLAISNKFEQVKKM